MLTLLVGLVLGYFVGLPLLMSAIGRIRRRSDRFPGCPICARWYSRPHLHNMPGART